MLKTLFGIGANIGLDAFNNYWAGERAKQDREENYRYGELAAQNADMRTRALYNDFYSPEALMRQYKEAGISPGMMFGGTPGQGGMSGASATGAASVQTPFMPMSMLEGAQIENIKAQTEKTKAETKTISGENERGMAEIANILADNESKKASTCYTLAMETGQEIENKFKDATFNYSVKKFKEDANYMYWNAKKAEYESNIASNEAFISDSTINEAIGIVHEQYNNLIADTTLKWSTKNLTDQEKEESQNRIWKIVQDVQQGWVNALAYDKYTNTYSEWIENKIPYIEKELELEAERLGIEEKRVWVEGVSRTIMGIGYTINATSNALNRGRQGEYQGLPPRKMNMPNGRTITIPGTRINAPKYGRR